MMKIEFKNGLIFTTVTIVYQGRTKIIENVVIDTGASKSIISPDAVEEIGVFADLGDKIVSLYGVGGSVHNAFVKKIDGISVGKFKIKQFDIEFGLIDVNGEINGLLGLDLFVKAGAIIDLRNFVLEMK